MDLRRARRIGKDIINQFLGSICHHLKDSASRHIVLGWQGCFAKSVHGIPAPCH
jgi:hypothetical protein